MINNPGAFVVLGNTNWADHTSTMGRDFEGDYINFKFCGLQSELVRNWLDIIFVL